MAPLSGTLQGVLMDPCAPDTLRLQPGCNPTHAGGPRQTPEEVQAIITAALSAGTQVG